MAKRSKTVANERRRRTVARYEQQRAALKATIKDPTTPLSEKIIAQRSLQGLPRDASPTRVRNRDAIDGRPHGHLRTFRLSRVRFREAAHRGELPGITKASW